MRQNSYSLLRTAIGMAAIAFVVMAAFRLERQYDQQSAGLPPCAVLETFEQDLGQIVQGEVITASFTLRNVGGSRLIVRRDQSGGHGNPDVAPAMAVLPGTTAVIEASGRTEHALGSVVHRATYHTNDPLLPTFTLTVRGVVVPP